MTKTRIVCIAALLIASLSQFAFAEEKGTRPFSDEKKVSSFGGPSLHLGLGIRMKKSPDLDTYYSTVGGIKVSLFSIAPNDQMYMSFLAPGLQYAGKGIFAPSVTPVIFNHSSGIGFGFDLFPTRKDRDGGPIGASFNLDVIQMLHFFNS